VLTVYDRFCSRVWRRHSYQVHHWKFDEFDDNVRSKLDNIDLPKAPGAVAVGVSFVAPWDMEAVPYDLAAKSTAAITIPAKESLPAANNTSLATFLSWPARVFRGDTNSTLPIWGPESIVLDPRIQAAHEKIWRDLLVFGGWFTVVGPISHFVLRFN
jgi:hypothetical protein